MSDIFISYKRDDYARVEPIYRVLSENGFSVWWDQDICGGEYWRKRIEKELDEALCIIVVWSYNSVGDDGMFVQDEASRGLERGVLLPVRIDNVKKLPVGFGGCQTLDLVGWQKNSKDARIRDVMATAESIINQKALPKLQWPLRRRRRKQISAIGSVFFGVGLAALLIPDMKNQVCAAPGIESLCNKLGYSVPTKTCFKWQTTDERYPYTVRRSETPSETEDEAKAAALERAENEELSTACPSPENEIRRLFSAKMYVSKWHCIELEDGYRCGFDGNVLCKYKNRRVEYGAACR